MRNIIQRSDRFPIILLNASLSNDVYELIKDSKDKNFIYKDNMSYKENFTSIYDMFKEISFYKLSN